MKTYQWIGKEKKLIRAMERIEREESFSLGDLAQEWTNRKATLQKARDDMAIFRTKVTKLCADLNITKKMLIGMTDIDTFKEG